MYIVYKITFPNNKVYVGMTKKSLDKRFSEHIYHRNSGKHRPIYTAMRKYKDSAIPSILEENLTFEQAEEREKYYISTYNSTNREYGYNLSLGGAAGNIASEEGKVRWKEKMEEKYKDPEYVKKITKHLVDRKNTDINYNENQRKYITDYFKKEENRIKHAKDTGGKPFICNETGEIFYSQHMAARKLNILVQNLNKVLKNKRKRVSNLTFTYLKEKGK